MARSHWRNTAGRRAGQRVGDEAGWTQLASVSRLRV